MDLDGPIEPGGNPVHLALALAVSHLGSPLEPGGHGGVIGNSDSICKPVFFGGRQRGVKLRMQLYFGSGPPTMSKLYNPLGTIIGGEHSNSAKAVEEKDVSRRKGWHRDGNRPTHKQV